MIGQHKTYLKYIVRHKLYAMRECFKRGLYWRGLVHDLDKFTPSSFKAHTQKHFEGKVDASLDTSYDLEWLKHQKRNLHHWQAWILMDDRGNIKALPMPERYWKEMVCDWIATSCALGFDGIEDAKSWYLYRRDGMLIHSKTKKQIEEYLQI